MRQGPSRAAWAGAAILVQLLIAPGRAAELADIASARPCSLIPEDGLGASGNCAAAADGRSLTVSLTARQIDLANHPEDAALVTFELPEGVALPGSTARTILVDGLMLYNSALAPEVWRINADRTLNIHLINRLAPGPRGATNLHTHGLLVSPSLATRAGRALEPVGDTVYVCTIPEGTDPASPSATYCTMHAAYYGAKTSEMNYRLVLPADHPEGLFWYHPHVHMIARDQVGAGLSGLIFVKNGAADLSGGARMRDGSQPRERLLMLKDIQLGAVAGADQGLLKASYLPVEQHDAGLCGTPAAGEPYRGACFNASSGWLFTVNGQLYPHLTVKAGGKEIWRIANTSADMSYDIALVERDSGRPLRMQLIARDGVAAAQEGGNGPILIERALLMPSARIEVAIDRTTSEGLFVDAQPLEAVLKSYGYYSGGDAWPAVDLAAVTFEAAPASTASASTPSPPPLPANATARSAHKHKGSRPALERTFVPMLVRGWQPAAGPGAVRSTRSAEKPIGVTPRGDTPRRSESAATPGPGARPFPLPSSEECAPLGPGEERIIALAIDKTGGEEKFKIGAVRAKRTALTPGEWDAAVQKAIDASRAFADNGPLLCAHAGTTETWTIVNKPFQDNQETHNFHIHQTKFEVVDVSDPNARIEVPRGGASAKRMVDNYPVPIGGSIRIKVRFLEQQAGGRFVFHCHILEHEDKGMMAEIEVLPGGTRGRRN